MNSIVKELAAWTQRNATTLSGRDVQLTNKFPESGSSHPWKASIELAHQHIILSYTVWERTVLQTELIVMNTSTGKTLVMDEGAPNDPSAIQAELDEVIRKLLDGTYGRMSPDPKLTIS